MRGIPLTGWALFAVNCFAAVNARAEDSRADVATFAVVERVQQKGNVSAVAAAPQPAANAAAGGFAVGPAGPYDTMENRVRVGVGVNQRSRWADDSITNNASIEESRSFEGQELSLRGLAASGYHWAGPRLGFDVTLNGNAGRYLTNADVPVTEILDASSAGPKTSYWGEGITLGSTYAMTRLWQVFLTLEGSNNTGLGIETISKGITLGTRLFHTPDTTSTLQVKARTDNQLGLEMIQTYSVTYGVKHDLSRMDQINLEFGEEEVLTTPGSGHFPSPIYNARYAHNARDQTYSVNAGRVVGRRPITNEQTLDDDVGASFSEKWLSLHQVSTLTISRMAERDVFDQSGLSSQTVDSGRVEHSFGVVKRAGFTPGNDYDRIVLSFEADHAASVVASAHRITFGIGYYATL